MRFGINVDVDENLDGFIKICEDSVPHINTFIDINTSQAKMGRVAKSLKNVGSYITFLDANGGEDVFTDWDEKLEKISKLLAKIPKKQVLGIGLVRNVHAVMRRGSSRRGIPKANIVSSLNQLSEVIRAAGMKVALHQRLDDVEGGLWNDVDYDIHDLDMFISKKSVHVLERLKTDRAIWFGRAGRFGGNIMPSVHKNVVRRLAETASGSGRCDLIFLWSDKNNKRFHWSHEQAFSLTANEIRLLTAGVSGV